MIFNLKNKRKSHSINKNGINIDGCIAMENNQSLSPKFELIRAFIIAITAISSVFLGCSYIDLDINYFVVAIYGLLLTALYCCFNFVSNKNKKFVSISIIAHALIMAMFTKKFWSGFLVIIDSYFIEIEQSTQFSETVSDISSEYWYATVAVMLIITILIAVLSLACYYKNNFLVLFLLTFPFFELGAFWGLVPNYFFFTVLMICWVSTFAMQLANWNWIHIKGKSAFTLKPNSAKFYISSKQLIRHSSSIIVFTVSAISVATVAGILLLAAVFGYERPSSVNELRYKIKMAVEDFSFDNYSNFFSYFDSEFDFLPTKSVGGTNGGKLGRSDKIIFSGKDALKIISPKSVGPLYLKGYCAGDYTGKSWDQFDFSVYEKYEATFNEKNKTVFQNYNYDACSILINKDITGNIDTNLFEVEVKNASKKYYYAPYFTNYSDATNSNPNMETTVLAKDTEYEIPYYNFQDNENNNNALKYYSAYYNNLITNELYKLNHDYSNYADFVKANYCDINFSVVEEAYNDIVRNYLYINDDYDYYSYAENGAIDPALYSLDIEDVCNAINKYFADNYTYSLNPGKTPSGEDFVKYFLEEQKEGYCSYFASAGTLLLRAFGYPTRFAEGYYVDSSEFSKITDGDYYVASPTDKSAHAWCEVFVGGLGWLPVELTPGFSEGSNPNNSSDLNSNSSSKSSDSTNSSAPATTTTKPSSSSTPDSSKSSSDQSNSKINESKPNSSNSSGVFRNQTSANNRKVIIKTIITTAIVFISLLIILVIWNLIRKYKVSKMLSNLKNSNRNKAVISVYFQCLKLFKLLNVEITTNSSNIIMIDKFKKEFKNKGISKLSEKFEFITLLAVEADMSNNDISEKNYSKALIMYNEINISVWNKLGKIQQIIAKYFKFYY